MKECILGILGRTPQDTKQKRSLIDSIANHKCSGSQRPQGFVHRHTYTYLPRSVSHIRPAGVSADNRARSVQRIASRRRHPGPLACPSSRPEPRAGAASRPLLVAPSSAVLKAVLSLYTHTIKFSSCIRPDDSAAVRRQLLLMGVC